MKSVIGHGGNGIVLKGFQPELNRLVAVKVMAPHLAASAAARQRFAREAQATAAIVHPAVMPILSVNSTGQLPFLIMPCVDCESLQQRIDRVGGLSVVDVLRIGLQVARGLQAAHAQGLVHRDVKPANILLERGVERVMLTDFGLARAVDDASLTRTGLIAGTPQYMSPEQARGDAVDPRSDLFSLGSVLYVMATGRPPFRAETSYGILRRVTDETPRAVRELNPEVPEWLCAIILRLLEKSAADRFQTAEAVAELLEDCLAHVQQPAAIPLPITARSLVKSSGPLSQWRLWLATIGGGLLLVLIAYQTATLVEGPSNDFQAEYGTDSQTAVDRNSLASGKLLTPIPSSSGSGVSATGQSAGFSAGSSHDLPDDPSFDIEQLHEEIDQLLEDTSELP
ncbi:MAG: serine/threonine-protein kinase [Planctomycetaceae bacterium]